MEEQIVNTRKTSYLIKRFLPYFKKILLFPLRGGGGVVFPPPPPPWPRPRSRAAHGGGGR